MAETYKSDYKWIQFIEDAKTKIVADSEAKKAGKRRVGVALFGLGRMGTVHLKNLLATPTVNVLYAVDGYKARRDHLDCEWDLSSRGTKVIAQEDASLAWEDPQVDAVMVCTPTDSHEELCTGALKGGKAVFCEKPLARTVGGVRRLYALADQMKRPLLCAFNRRFDPTYSQIRDRVLEGAVGPQIQMVKAVARDCPPNPMEYMKTSGGIFQDSMIHDIDYMCWLVGDYPTQVTCHGSTFNKEIEAMNDFDTVAATLKFPNGTIGVIDMSRSANYGYDQRLEVFGSSGMLNAEGVRPTSVVTNNASGTTLVPISYGAQSRYSEAYKEELAHFLRVVQDEFDTGKANPEKVKVKGSETLADCRVSAAIEKSAKQGGALVKIDWSAGWEDRMD